MMTNARRRVVIDVETEATIDLKKAGAYAYSAHERTDIMCLSWRDIEEPPGATRIWFPTWHDMQCPTDLQVAIATGAELHAFNAFFETSIFDNIMTPRYGWPRVKHGQWHCISALAGYYGYPQNLDRCMKAMRLGAKDAEGHALMMKMTNPMKRSKKILSTWADNLARLGAYCQHDVNDEALIIGALPPLPQTERRLWSIDQEINRRGIPFDVELVDAAVAAVDSIQSHACAELAARTGGTITTPGQVKRIVEYCADNGFPLPDLGASTVDGVLEMNPDIPPNVRFVLETRRAAGTAAVKKFKRAQSQLVDGRARGLLRYFGAHTGRWTGQGTQPSNMPRAHFED